MNILVLLLVSLVPGLLWVWFFYRQDREKEPKRIILITFVAGMVAIIPAALYELPFQHLLGGGTTPQLTQFLVAVFVVGLGEEGAKLLATYWAAFRRSAFNEPADGIIYAVTASLGFAALENLLYTFTFGLNVAPVRAVVTSLAHASFGGVAGLYLGLAKFREDVGLPQVLQGLGIAALLHGVYDYIIIAELVHPLVSLAIVYATYRYIAWKIRVPDGPVGVR